MTGLGEAFTNVASYLSSLAGPPVWFWVAFIGWLVGSVEIVARYRDDPWRAVRSRPAMLYVVVNILACLLMLNCLTTIRPDWLFKDWVAEPHKQELYLVLAAGFGAVALFRSSLFKIKTVDGELGVGPSIVLDTLLFASDRAVDRFIATPRGVAVAEIMKDVSFERAKVPLPAYCFALMQNVPPQEQKDIADQVNALTSATMGERVRALNLGLAIMNVVGERVLRQAVQDLYDFIREDPAIEQQDIAKVAALMADIDFAKASPALGSYCFSLSKGSSAEVQEAFAKQVDQLARSQLSARVKTLIYGLLLANLVGYPILKLAIEQLRQDIANDRILVAPAANINEAANARDEDDRQAG